MAYISCQYCEHFAKNLSNPPCSNCFFDAERPNFKKAIKNCETCETMNCNDCEKGE